MTSRPARRWLTPEGARISLIRLTATGNTLGRPGLRDGGSADGWWLIVRHPNGWTLSSTYLPGLSDRDPKARGKARAELAAALAAVNAIPALPRRNHQ